MPKAPASAAVGALLALLTAQAMAMGIGRFDNHGVLGGPLHAALDLRLDDGESISRECISVDALVGEQRLAPSTLRWALENGGDAAERRLRVVSSVAVDEPVVTLTVQFSCPTRLTRKFVALLDPPGIALATAGGPAAPVAPPVIPLEPATAPVLKVVESAQPPKPAAEARPARPAPPPRREAAAAKRAPAQRSVAAATPAAKATRPARQTAQAPAAPAAGPRLKLEAADDAALRARLDLRQPSQAASAAAPTVVAAVDPAASAASAPEDPALALARERLQALEDNFTRLQAEGRATQASLLRLQQRLQEAEAERYSNPLVYGLGALAALLAAALVFVLWRRPPTQAAAAPWYGEAAEPPARAAADDWQAQAPDTMPPALPRRDETPLPETTASPMLLSQVQALAAEAPAPVPDPALAVEELIDLEQQAEFFVVLGQDEAAIDLLMGHLRSSGGASPLPYLKLLEIYRRRGDREASERIRERFNRRFNAYAPEWQADPAEGRTLADYPTVTASLQDIWGSPKQAMRALEASLFRRDGSTTTFDLPAYRELLFLYSVARDLAEREAQSDNVDLLLPLGGEAGEPSALTRLHPSPTMPARLDPPTEVDVDITSLDDGAGLDSGRPSRLVTDFGPTSGAMPLSEPSPTRH